jgi:hypothetical protein
MNIDEKMYEIKQIFIEHFKHVILQYQTTILDSLYYLGKLRKKGCGNTLMAKWINLKVSFLIFWIEILKAISKEEK